MWEFPGVEAKVPFHEAASLLARDLGFGTGFGRHRDICRSPDPAQVELPLVTHTFSHLRAHYRPFLLQTHLSTSAQGEWIVEDRLNEIPRSVAQQKIAKLALAEAGS
jgi:hypothetical protein